VNRREFLGRALLGAAATAVGPLACGSGAEPGDDGWERGPIRHLLPTASHERIRLKASFEEPLDAAPRLVVGERSAAGEQSDSSGRFWSFDVADLAPATTHELRLTDSRGGPLGEPWPLATFPPPDALPRRFRLLCYTCAGGPDFALYRSFGFGFLPVPARQRLLSRALAFEPDAVVANGDHVYWDLRSRARWAMGGGPLARLTAGSFDRAAPVLGGDNEEVLIRAFGPQIAGLYGVRFRSVPVFFLQDDHDYTENDEASGELRTFPPDRFMLEVARATQRLFYPELLADATLPGEVVSAAGLSESFGSLRYGRLCEALLYDCRRHLRGDADPGGPAGFVPPAVERWLVERSERSDAAHLAHVPSTPVLWTAGKWGEWYPDVLVEGAGLNPLIGKPFWAEGWRAQHDRLLSAAAVRRDRTPLFVGGDLHATAAGRILRAGHLRLEEHPVVSLLCGSIGTGGGGWPSEFRGTPARPSGTLEAEEWVAPIEENGFSLLDFEPDALRVSLFRWRPEEGVEAIDALEPFRVLEIPRPGPSSA
jgi:hypothetical protein